MRRIAAMACVGLAGLLMTAGDLQADGFRISFGSGFGSGCRGGYYGGASYYRGYPSHRRIGSPYVGGRSWRGSRRSYYAPPSIYRHRNHFHYVPGHYDVPRRSRGHYRW